MTIYTSNLPPAVELRRLKLEENGIPVVVLNQRDSSYHFGAVDLKVHKENSEIASQLILDSEE